MRLTLAIFLLSAISLWADEFGINFKGFVRGDWIYDTRNSARLRENAIMLYPLPFEDDGNGNDLNDNPLMNMFTLHSRINGIIRGPKAFGATTSGRIEGEFFGGTDDDVNGFRLRHAYLLMEWNNTHLLFGQFWNPMFIVGVLPSFNFASPFLAYGRRPQLKIDQHFGKWNILLAASMQSDFKSIGPDAEGNPTRNTIFIKNSTTPSTNLTINYSDDKFIIGAGIDHKRLIPRLENENGATREDINSFAGIFFIRKDIADLSIKFQTIYGGNLADVVMLGGYALQRDDPTKYTNINIFSAWTELLYGKDIRFALFAGYLKNLGTNEPAINDRNRVYAMGYDIGELYRIAPSLQFVSGTMRVVAEAEITEAGYAKELDEYLQTQGMDYYRNIRYTITAFYHF